jgi:hypothetical protein
MTIAGLNERKYSRLWWLGHEGMMFKMFVGKNN